MARKDPTHAGCITYRDGAGGREYLLVRPSSGADEWVYPKGHVEAGESPERTALRELREEAGIEGDIVGTAGTSEFVAVGETVRAVFFLTRFLREVPRDEYRDVSWLDYDAALARLTFDDARELLRSAHARLHDRPDGGGQKR